jgi:hypothetical protein
MDTGEAITGLLELATNDDVGWGEGREADLRAPRRPTRPASATADRTTAALPSSGSSLAVEAVKLLRVPSGGWSPSTTAVRGVGEALGRR